MIFYYFDLSNANLYNIGTHMQFEKSFSHFPFFPIFKELSIKHPLVRLLLKNGKNGKMGKKEKKVIDPYKFI
jgi:hypothetical protein